MEQTTAQSWIEQAIQLAIENVETGHGGPFGALIVRDRELIATGVNSVTSNNDPTAHAEVMAIRTACSKLGVFQLTNCELFSTCEPCPMCLGAIYWARPLKYYYACTSEDARRAGFDDDFIYRQIALAPSHRSIPGIRISIDGAIQPFEKWLKAARKKPY